MSSLCSGLSGSVVCTWVPSSVSAPIETDISLRLSVACIVERRKVVCATDVQGTDNPFAL